MPFLHNKLDCQLYVNQYQYNFLRLHSVLLSRVVLLHPQSVVEWVIPGSSYTPPDIVTVLCKKPVVLGVCSNTGMRKCVVTIRVVTSLCSYSCYKIKIIFKVQ